MRLLKLLLVMLLCAAGPAVDASLSRHAGRGTRDCLPAALGGGARGFAGRSLGVRQQAGDKAA